MKRNRNKLLKLLPMAALTLAMSCNENEFLDEVNPNTITTETFWESQKQFESALVTVYGATQFQSISGELLQHEMILGDIAGTESWYRPFAFRNLTYTDASIYVVDKWNELYVGIYRANQVIQNLADADPSVFQEGAKESIEAQAKFLRAFFYFQLAHTYGGAVIRTDVPTGLDDLEGAFSSIEKVTNTMIIPDLEYAQANLPQVWDGKDLGRITWGAATSLLGKVYLYQEDWTQAASLFKTVIDSGIYSLTEDPMDNIRHDTEFNSESIFEVAYNADVNPGAPGGAVDDNQFETGAEASGMARAIGQLNFGAFNTLLPTYYLHELFINDEVDPDNPINDGNQQSKRMFASIAPLNGEGLYYGLEYGEKGGWAFGQSAYVKKHTNWYHLPNEDGLSRSGINFRHIRLADVYLMYAEAILNSGGSVDEAIDYIDLIRSRAGVKTLRQYLADNGNTFPQLHVSIQVHGAQPMVAPTRENVMTHLKRVERPIELCFEGHRWKDLVRWGMVQEVFTELRADEVWREANKEAIFDQFPLRIVERVRPDFFLCSDNYDPAVHNYFPIPAQELQTNEGL
ncbi:RagB/SusD family nutrient uptake outer membrane protein [Croceivirga sp. JEA036]|uniref:RagB/SusD family nutrient uptake outer membrane protein n=1 Tax=Croceivirga sp. JEA036 TaxID=2721162 RepID=UPI00143C3346|nr:RagB/SusD family nutrient uptake outer membrane protein [Croceivirga sp. JEA036]NJB35246.1 RagB/SusD family nutrient uptake outer membrane protein [Croceivirga sp. JEA036]